MESLWSNKLIKLSLCLVVVMLALSSCKSEPKAISAIRYVTRLEGIPMYEKPDTSSKVIHELLYATKLHCIAELAGSIKFVEKDADNHVISEKVSDWVQVTFRKTTGWVLGYYLAPYRDNRPKNTETTADSSHQEVIPPNHPNAGIRVPRESSDIINIIHDRHYPAFTYNNDLEDLRVPGDSLHVWSAPNTEYTGKYQAALASNISTLAVANENGSLKYTLTFTSENISQEGMVDDEVHDVDLKTTQKLSFVSWEKIPNLDETYGEFVYWVSPKSLKREYGFLMYQVHAEIPKLTLLHLVDKE